MSSGTIRRIDDLGRIVFPREVRRMLGIHEGDPLEISVNTDESTIIIKRYNTMEDLLGVRTCRSVLSVLCRHHENCSFYILDHCGTPVLNREWPASANEEVLEAARYSTRKLTQKDTTAAIPIICKAQNELAGYIVVVADNEDSLKEAVKTTETVADLMAAKDI